jgi:hypothetical protein
MSFVPLVTSVVVVSITLDVWEGKENTMAKDFNIYCIDNGYCRVNYVAKNPAGQRVYYCLQDEGKNFGGVICYRCSNDDFEPDYPIVYGRDRFEVPTGNSDIEVVIRDYLTGV